MRCEDADECSDGRLVSPSADRNKAPILAVLERVLPKTGTVLEIASGTGQHIVHFALGLPALTWQPTDVEPECLSSISGWLAAANLPNVRAPVELDVLRQPWPISRAEALVCLNLLHIAPWTVVPALFAGARAVLGPGGIVFLYGPYFVAGTHTAPSNVAFDRTLRAQNSAWGIRDLADVTRAANAEGFKLTETVQMPANNLSVVFRNTGNPS